MTSRSTNVLGIDWDTTAEHCMDALSFIAGKFKTVVVITCKQQISVLEPARMLRVDETKILIERYCAGEPLDYTRWIIGLCYHHGIGIMLSADNAVYNASSEAGVPVILISGLLITREEVLLSKLKLVLESKGFKTSWADPLRELMHNINQPNPQQKHDLFIEVPPIPQIAPFDLACCSIKLRENFISFELCLYFVNKVEKLIDPPAHNAFIDAYTTKWLPHMEEYFADFATAFELESCTNFNPLIKYCLRGNVTIEQWGKIPRMILELKSLAKKN